MTWSPMPWTTLTTLENMWPTMTGFKGIRTYKIEKSEWPPMTEWPTWTLGTHSSTGLSSILGFLGVRYLSRPPINMNRSLSSKINIHTRLWLQARAEGYWTSYKGKRKLAEPVHTEWKQRKNKLPQKRYFWCPTWKSETTVKSPKTLRKVFS